MAKLSDNYKENRLNISTRLRTGESFDIIEKRLCAAGRELSFFYIDGFIKDGEMLRIMQHLLSQKSLNDAESTTRILPYVEVELVYDDNDAIRSVLSGQALILGETFGAAAILVDARTYPARSTEEPDSDRVMQGSHDGFVETLVTNTALIRRRIRDERLTMSHFNMGGSSKTDVVVCYMDGVADGRLVSEIKEKIKSSRPKSLTLGFQSLAETLIRKGWLNPFPKIRTTERPDTAAAQLLEGSVLVICDTSPQVMILPTSIFHYLEQTDDYYFPPLTGSYLRAVRTLILLASVIITPLWYLYLEYADVLPRALLFLVPENAGALPIILQLFLVELAIDGLKIASMNTPDMLSNSLSIVGALILGDFAVEVGWLCADVILYMAFVAIANFAQQNHELGYAFKFMRMMILALVYFFGIWGFAVGIVLFSVFVATNTTVTGRHYLYPLVPFNKAAMKRLLFRTRKQDFD
ncbi:MAG: spore germination protein [Ruminococcaceae bacterium]|nr:spore germination protein [Oscillospiraceae bacterium]